MLRTLALCGVLLAALLAFAGGALAQVAVQDPVAEQYQSQAVSADNASGEASQAPKGLEARIGGLPFTGIDMIVLGGTALVLTGTGFALHRLSAPRVDAP